MRYRSLGTSGIQASAVGFGAWAIGGLGWGGTDQDDSIRAIQRAIDEGIKFIDTAPVYGLGVSEEIVGKAIAGRRKRVVLATKCGHVWHLKKGRHVFDAQGERVYIYLGPESIRYEIEQSLRRLKTDYIDLYQEHWPDPSTAIEDTMGALVKLKDQGKIRAIGLSNVTVEELQSYQKSGTVDTDQEKYNMLQGEHETDLFAYCKRAGIAVLAYSPLAQGLLSGKVGPDREFPKGDQRREDPKFSQQQRAKVTSMLKAMEPIAENRGLTLAQLVIAWTVSQPGVTHALVGARNAQQAEENAKAGEVMLTEYELTTIDKILTREQL